MFRGSESKCVCSYAINCYCISISVNSFIASSFDFFTFFSAIHATISPFLLIPFFVEKAKFKATLNETVELH